MSYSIFLHTCTQSCPYFRNPLQWCLWRLAGVESKSNLNGLTETASEVSASNSKQRRAGARSRRDRNWARFAHSLPNLWSRLGRRFIVLVPESWALLKRVFCKDGRFNFGYLDFVGLNVSGEILHRSVFLRNLQIRVYLADWNRGVERIGNRNGRFGVEVGGRESVVCRSGHLLPKTSTFDARRENTQIESYYWNRRSGMSLSLITKRPRSHCFSKVCSASTGFSRFTEML